MKYNLSIKSITFGASHNIVHIEMDDCVNLHDVLQVVRQWNSGKWEHPHNGDTNVLAGGDAKFETFSFQ